MKNNQPKSTKGGKRPGAGRPKGAVSQTTKDIAEIAQTYGPDAIQRLWMLAQTADSAAAQVAAIKEILDRGYGKAKQTVDGNLNGKFVIELQKF